MQMKAFLALPVLAILLSGCGSTTHKLTASGQNVTFTEQKPDEKCQLIGELTGVQSNWFNNTGDSSHSLRGAANDLRNQAAAKGGNVIYAVTSPSENVWSSLAPLDSEMTGQVYRCP